MVASPEGACSVPGSPVSGGEAVRNTAEVPTTAAGLFVHPFHSHLLRDFHIH